MIKRAMDFVRTALPGLTLCGLVTITAYALERIESAVLGRAWLESLVLSILIGTAIRTFHRLDARLEPGIQVGAKLLLEIAVVLLGASISASTLLENGIGLISGIAAVVVIAIVLSFAIGCAFGLPRKMAILIACGNSICGNSAIAAVAPVIDADSEDVAAAIAFTAVLGVIVVLVLPELVSLLSFSPVQFGVFAGLTASHPLANAPTVVARDLRDEAFIVPQFSESEGFAENLFGLGRCGRFDAIPRHRVADFITALCMTAAGYGVVLVPQSMKSLAPADVAFCAIADYSEEAELALAYRTRESAPLRQKFCRVCNRRVFRQEKSKSLTERLNIL
jgi:hypothetical protein